MLQLQNWAVSYTHTHTLGLQPHFLTTDSWGQSILNLNMIELLLTLQNSLSHYTHLPSFWPGHTWHLNEHMLLNYGKGWLQKMSFWASNALGVRQEVKLEEVKWMTVLMSSQRYYYLIHFPPLAERQMNDDLGHLKKRNRCIVFSVSAMNRTPINCRTSLKIYNACITPHRKWLLLHYRSN